MTITHVGSLTLGGAMPGAVAVSVASQADIEARLAALLSFTPTPVDFTVSLTLAIQTLASVQAAMVAGITPPSIDLQIALILAQIAELTASLSIIATFGGYMAAAGIHVYAYDGTVGNMAVDLDSQLFDGVPGGTGAGQHCNALVLLTTVGASWTAMSNVFQVTP
jgi:hypothetical protein